MPRAARAPQTDISSSYVDRIREHVERDEVAAARRLVAEALREGSTEPGLAHWAEVLAPAKVLGSHPATGSDLEAEIRCLNEHAGDYKGQWVAVLGEKLLAHAETLDELRKQITQLALPTRPLVHFMG
jgi:hypothetical protein